jgi:hypothetical protein
MVRSDTRRAHTVTVIQMDAAMNIKATVDGATATMQRDEAERFGAAVARIEHAGR